MVTDASRLLLLLNWMSPTFPVGGFAYSHGLEWAIETGSVTDAASLRAWIGELLARGSGWNDAVLFSACWDETDFDALNDLAIALCVSQERYLETTSLGGAFASAAANFKRHPSESWSPLNHCRAEPAQGMPAFAGMTDNIDDTPIAYPIAAGCACRGAGIAKEDALLAWLQQFASAQVSVAVRLVPLGQSKGLEVLRDLIPTIAAVAECVARATLDDLGSCTIGAEIAAMKHEMQEPRIFRT
ncbi:MAG: urease accessory protein UreF [Rhizobiales bacterium]|nr:urease accessory protein UreF [Hyphomicrobiales bacterium]